MQNKTIRYATAAIVLSLTALIIHSLGGSPDGTTLTFAQVLDQIRQIRPYAVTSTTRYQHTSKSLTRRVSVLNALQRREEFPDGLIRIFDHSKQPVGMLQLNPSTKQALWQVYPDRDVKAINSDIMSILRAYEENPGGSHFKDRGLSTMDGHATKSFQLSNPHNIITVWADVDTRYPVRIETEHPKLKRTIVQTEFDFAPVLDPGQFTRIPPQGYTLTERAAPSAGQVDTPSKAFRSRTYTQTIHNADGSVKRVCRHYEPTIDRCRREYDSGQHEVYDYSRKPARTMMLDTKEKRAVLEIRPGERRTRINIDFLKILSDAQAEPELHKLVDRGERTLEGRITRCINVPGQHNHFKLVFWLDLETGLPVRIEQNRGSSTAVWTDFEFDVDIDPKLLALDAPTGYRFEEVTYPVNQGELSNEAHLIEGLKVIATLLGGTFPEALTWRSIQNQMRSHIQTNNIELSAEQTRDLRVAIEPFNAFVGRLRSSPRSYDLDYHGREKRLGDKEAVILWYRPEGSSSYHVVYGDLRVEEVPPDDLPR